MRLLLPLLMALSSCAPATLAMADQNPVPVNVGVYSYAVSTVSTATSTLVMIPRNTARAGLFIQNNGAVSITVKPSSAVLNPLDGIVIGPGGSWEPAPPPVDALYAGAASGSNKVTVIEFVK